jgi:L-asparaginase
MQGVQGIVVAGTGNGTLHHALEAALLRAQDAGVRVLRATRCAAGPALGVTALPSAGSLSPVQARVELLLQLMGPA